MPRSGKLGFVLPYALLLGASLLVIATLFVVQGEHQMVRAKEALLRKEASNTLRLNIRPLVEGLNENLSHRHTASALIPLSLEKPEVFRSVLLMDDGEKTSLLHSSNDESDETIPFLSSTSEAKLKASLIPFSPDGVPTQISIAWAIQDLGLLPSQETLPDFWPLPDCFWTPYHNIEVPFSQYLDETTHGQWREGPWIPIEEPLPFQMDSSPALVPVVEELKLRIGIFATGPLRSREKVIRARFYLEGKLWNPYNRPLQVHYGSGMRSIFQLLFYNLPEIRIHNLDLGVSTNWIPLDGSGNAYSGKYGFHGWIRLPPVINPGHRYIFSEPDEKWQPEGLARTLHPAFMVGPADHVKVEFRESTGGVHVACLPLEANDPVAAAFSGDGWFRAEEFPVSFDDMEFQRADEGKRPFYLSAGSLSFRRENVQMDLALTWRPDALSGNTDPRRKILNHEDGHRNPHGEWTKDKDLVTIKAEYLLNADNTPPDSSNAEPKIPLFSWPAKEPESLIEAMDLPQWRNGFRLGTPEADDLNSLLHEQWSWADDPNILVLEDREGKSVQFRRSIPVNLLSPKKWLEILGEASITNGSIDQVFPAYPWYQKQNPDDFRLWSPMELHIAANELVSKAQISPNISVGDFFNRGLLVDSIQSHLTSDPLHKFMPLRGWLRSGIQIRGHGSAWLMHMAVRVRNDSSEYWRTARVWLLEISKKEKPGHLEIIQFEWTVPDDHTQLSIQ